MKQHTLHHRQQGFTIIELTISTAVFAVILLLCSITMLQVARYYQKGVTTNHTQEATRDIMEELAGHLQFNGGFHFQPAAAGTPGSICFDDVRYTFATNLEVKESVSGDPHQGLHALWRDQDASASCTPIDFNHMKNFTNASDPNPGGKELVPLNTRIVSLDIDSSSAPLYRITVHLISDDDEGIVLVGGVPHNCKNIIEGGQFCADSTLTTTVFKRI